MSHHRTVVGKSKTTETDKNDKRVYILKRKPSSNS